jgi:hypothetical protein
VGRLSHTSQEIAKADKSGKGVNVATFLTTRAGVRHLMNQGALLGGFLGLVLTLARKWYLSNRKALKY